MRLPLIPLSPYIQTLREYAHVLAQTTKSLSEQQLQEDNANITSSLQKSVNKEREKLDRLTKSMQSIQSSCLLDFNIYDIAKEIAYINCSLFRLVTLDPAWLCNFDKQSNMVPLLDFHRYVSHAFAHQVIYGDPKKKAVIQLIHLAYILLHVYRDFSGCTAVLTSLHMPEVRRLESMWAPCPVKLLQVYHELVAMLSPDNNYEAYHHRLWLHTQRFLDVTPSKSQMIAVPFMQAHLAVIQNLVQTHASVQAAPDVVLSSAGQPLLASTVQLLEFCQQFNKMDPADLEQYAVLKNHNSKKRASVQSSSGMSTSSSKRASTSNNKAIKLSTSPCLDLDMLRSDANVYHWIVSRAYLTRSQLHAESLHVEPLAVGEIELESEEEHDLFWDFYGKQEECASVVVAAAVNKEPPSLPPVESLPSLPNTSDSQKQQQQQKDVEQATVEELNVVDISSAGEPSLSLDPVVSNEQVSPVEPAGADKASTQGLEASANEIIVHPKEEDCTISVDHGTLKDTTDQPSVEPQAAKEDKAPTTTVSTSVENEANTQDHHQQQQEQSVQEMVLQPIPVAVEKKDIAPADTEEEEEEAEPVLIEHTLAPVATATRTSLEFGDIDDEDDDIIILTEEDDEEWTGYPLDSTPSQTVQDTEEEEEDEEWTGYPFTSQDEQDTPERGDGEEDEEEEEEVWKGYPIPSSEDDEPQSQLQPQPQQQQQQQLHENDDDDDQDEARKSPVDLSSPVTPSEEDSELVHRHEEWKGYQRTSEEEEMQKHQGAPKDGPHQGQQHNDGDDDDDPSRHNSNNKHHHQLHAIGKAAARRMQYSLSSTDTNRKRLPSPFAPSSST
ncbi:hypothetical protein MBANPS3_001962 [Mucor bainieri]